METSKALIMLSFSQRMVTPTGEPQDSNLKHLVRLTCDSAPLKHSRVLSGLANLFGAPDPKPAIRNPDGSDSSQPVAVVHMRARPMRTRVRCGRELRGCVRARCVEAVRCPSVRSSFVSVLLVQKK